MPKRADSQLFENVAVGIVVAASQNLNNMSAICCQSTLKIAIRHEFAHEFAIAHYPVTHICALYPPIDVLKLLGLKALKTMIAIGVEVLLSKAAFDSKSGESNATKECESDGIPAVTSLANKISKLVEAIETAKTRSRKFAVAESPVPTRLKPLSK